ncbi:MAG: diguanylate cyclase (GGDEF)-like protein, partial [Chlamydiales bacterium]
MIRESHLEYLECRHVDRARRQASRGSVVVVFQDVPVGRRGDGAGTDPVTKLVNDIEGRRVGDGVTGLLVVLPPGDSSSFAALAESVEGPWDVIRRDASVEEWRLRTQRLTSQLETLSELEELRFRATHDDLTGLLRPAEFDQRLREHFSAAQRQGHDLALILIDLDRFGAINKDFDHVVGDQLLERVACAVRGQLRTEDIAGRLGGDEFAVALPFTGSEEAARVVERLRHSIRSASVPAAGDDRSVAVAGSLGFEVFPGPQLSS